MTFTPGLGSHQPDDSVIGERSDGVDETVDEISVVIAPPHHHRVDDVVEVFVHQVPADDGLDTRPDDGVGVFVPVEFLDGHPRV